MIHYDAFWNTLIKQRLIIKKKFKQCLNTHQFVNTCPLCLRVETVTDFLLQCPMLSQSDSWCQHDLIALASFLIKLTISLHLGRVWPCQEKASFFETQLSCLVYGNVKERCFGNKLLPPVSLVAGLHYPVIEWALVLSPFRGVSVDILHPCYKRGYQRIARQTEADPPRWSPLEGAFKLDFDWCLGKFRKTSQRHPQEISWKKNIYFLGPD